MVSYRFPKAGILGKCSKAYAEIYRGSESEIVFSISINLFVPESAEQAHGAMKAYRLMVEKLFTNGVWYKMLKDHVPEGYFLKPDDVLRIKENACDSIRHFDAVVSDFEFKIALQMSVELLDKSMEDHRQAIMEFAHAIEESGLEALQAKSKFFFICMPNNFTMKTRTANKTSYFNRVASRYKHLLMQPPISKK